MKKPVRKSKPARKSKTAKVEVVKPPWIPPLKVKKSDWRGNPIRGQDDF
jgi:hypothetical protein